mmetsp:Transcript_2642/g.9655  ORF Transcript_2642/g.9655 Transcript_2642/m.9655 type:complete len:237 (-) Transcript_2642:15-725(-)
MFVHGTIAAKGTLPSTSASASAGVAAASSLCCSRAFANVFNAAIARRSMDITYKAVVGKSVPTTTPTLPPATCAGRSTRTASQSMSVCHESAGCRRRAFTASCARPLPITAALERTTASSILKSKTSSKIGTLRPPPPMPALAASVRPQKRQIPPSTSRSESGKSCLCRQTIEPASCGSARHARSAPQDASPSSGSVALHARSSASMLFGSKITPDAPAAARSAAPIAARRARIPP